jgi:hypothetical protein
MAIKEKFRYANEDESEVQKRNATGQFKAHHHPPSSVQPVEAEDPKESAGDHHLQKQVLNENVEGGASQQHPESPAGQHATGSFTGSDSPDLTKTPPRTSRKSGHR